MNYMISVSITYYLLVYKQHQELQCSYNIVISRST